MEQKKKPKNKTAKLFEPYGIAALDAKKFSSPTTQVTNGKITKPSFPFDNF